MEGTLFSVIVLFISTVLGQNSQNSLKPCNSPTNTCFVEPCLLAMCDKYPQANCRNYKCGSTCTAEFWYNGQEVTQMCGNQAGQNLFDILPSLANTLGNGGVSTNTIGNGGSTGTQTNTGCPNGETQINCFMEPCSVSSCPGVPTAQCKNNYCGMCKAEYWVGQQDVTSRCAQQNQGNFAVSDPQVNNNNVCPNGQPMANCAVRPCAFTSCSRYPYATCRDNYCGGCNAKFFMGQQEVTSQCSPQTQNSVAGPQMNTVGDLNPNTNGCPPSQVMRCNFSPCRVSSCANYPNAECRDEFCGGCYAKFYYNGQEVTSLCRRQQQQQRQPTIPWFYWLMDF